MLDILDVCVFVAIFWYSKWHCSFRCSVDCTYVSTARDVFLRVFFLLRNTHVLQIPMWCISWINREILISALFHKSINVLILIHWNHLIWNKFEIYKFNRELNDKLLIHLLNNWKINCYSIANLWSFSLLFFQLWILYVYFFTTK